MEVMKMKIVLTWLTLSFLGLSISGMIFSTRCLAEIDASTIVGAWLLDGDALDASHAGNDGKLNGTPSWVSGKFGKAMNPNGAFIVVPHSDSLNLNHMTAAAWINVAQYSDDSRILEKGVGNTDPWSVYNFLLSDPGESKLEFRPTIGGAGGRKRVHSNADIPLNEWTHVAATYDGKEVILYINGEIDKKEAVAGDLMQNENSLYIAESEFYDRSFKGLLDEVSLFNVVLSQNEIQEIMNNGLGSTLAVSSKGKLTTTWGKLNR